MAYLPDLELTGMNIYTTPSITILQEIILAFNLLLLSLLFFFYMWNTKRHEETYNSIFAMFLRSSSVQHAPNFRNHHLGIGERQYCDKQQGTAFTCVPSINSEEVMSQIERITDSPVCATHQHPEHTSLLSIEAIITILKFANSCIQLQDAINHLTQRCHN